jgi:chemotaxis protein methyltransferase CheR
VTQVLGTVSEVASLSEAQFNEISNLVKGLCGINLHQGKKELVKARLSKRLKALEFSSFTDYIDHVRQDPSGNELVTMLDALSTNLTQFFREPAHFQYLAEEIVPRMAAASPGGSSRLRIWSAGCSSGEEPYSLAITLAEAVANLARWDVAILATDLSTRVLARAAKGVYEAVGPGEVLPETAVRQGGQAGGRDGTRYQISENLRRLVSFARLNLFESWPMRGPFNVIFCRNVMIYFDKPAQTKLVNRFFELLAPGGTLCIGHSESLAGVQHRFQYVQPTVYEKA